MAFSTTAQEVFKVTMALIDNVSTSNYTADTSEYEPRALGILNILRMELFPYSDSFAPNENGGRPIAPKIRSLSEVIQLDDAICQEAMPYGLAAHLMLTEDPNAASFFQQRYEEVKARLARGNPQDWEPITDVYGGNPYNDYGAW